MFGPGSDRIQILTEIKILTQIRILAQKLIVKLKTACGCSGVDY